MKNYLLNALTCVLMSVGCYAQGIETRMMIVPADDLLKRLNCYSETTVQGVKQVKRDYLKAYADLIDLRLVSARIAEKFAKRGVELEDLEQSLKDLNDSQIRDVLGDVKTDELTQVLNVVRPDVVLELSYELKKGAVTNRLAFVLAAKDSYNKKVITAIAEPGLETVEENVPALLAQEVERLLQTFLDGLTRHSIDLEQNGRSILLTVQTKNGSEIDLTKPEKVSGKTYDQIFDDLLSIHKKTGSPTPNPLIAPSRFLYRNLRVPLTDEKGNGISARTWAFTVIKDLQEKYGLKGENATQALGDALIIITN